MTTTFNYTKKSIINIALHDINKIAFSTTLDSTDTTGVYTHASDTLNIMIKQWEADPGIKIWKRKQAYLFPAYGVFSFSLGTAGDNCTNSYVNTTLTASAASAATTLTVSSITGISSGDYIGIKLDDGTRYWTTVNGSPSGSTITLTAGLTGTASSGNTVITYTTKINRPLSIIRGTVKDLTNNSEIKLKVIGFDEYYDFPIKTSSGRPNNIYYEKQLNGTTPYTGTLYTYPVTNNVDQIITFSYQEPLFDATNDTDYLDFPQEYLAAIISNLEALLCRKYGKLQELQIIQPLADKDLDLIRSFDADDTDIDFEL